MSTNTQGQGEGSHDKSQTQAFGGAKKTKSLGPRSASSANGQTKQAYNGQPKSDFKYDGGAQKPKNAQGGQNAKKTSGGQKSKPTSSEHSRSQSSSSEHGNLVKVLSAEFNNYYSETVIVAALNQNQNDLDAARAHLTKSKLTSWASKVGASPAPVHATPSVAHSEPAQEAPAPARQPRANKKPKQVQEPVAVPIHVVSEPEAVVVEVADPLQVLTDINKHQQELDSIRTKIGVVVHTLGALKDERHHLGEEAKALTASLESIRARIHQIDVEDAQLKQTSTALATEFKQKTAAASK